MQVKIHSTYDSFIKNSKHFKEMLIFIEKEKNITPEKDKVFRFLDFDLRKLKCIILGMDPYPSTYKKDGVSTPVATGRSFEVANVEKWTDRYRQTSLAVIYKTLIYYKYGKIFSMDELRMDDIIKITYENIHDWYDAMESKGVMFLNSSLTTKIGKAGAHTDIWKDFMDELISYIADTKKDIKWLIWGKNALDRVSPFVDKKSIIYTCHPATRSHNTFIKDCCFSKVKGIDWF